MPLIPSILLVEIRKINDSEYSSFEEFPENLVEAASRWAEAIDTYASNVIPASTAVGAKEAFEAIMLQMTTPSSGLVLFPQAFTAYALALGTGMAPAFIAIPPPIPIILTPVFAVGNAGGTAEACANTMSTIIDTWFRTGTATPASGGSPVPWS